MADNHKKRCKKCKYRGTFGYQGDLICCNYIVITGHSRRCPADQCDKYEKGEKINLKGVIH